MFKQLPPITKNLLIINCIVFLLQLVLEQRGMDLADSLGLHFFLADSFGIWQFITYMFLHGSFTHLFFNMFSLWMFGRIIEQTMGPKRFLLYYFVCGVGAGVCQELWQLGQYYIEGMSHYTMVADPSGATMPMSLFLNSWTTIGASGACYGILLAFGMTFPNERIMLLIPPIPMKAKYFVAAFAVIELLSAFASNGNIAHFAHLGGMLFGLALILYWRKGGRGGGRRFNGWETWTPRRSRSPWERLKDGWKRMTARKPKMTVHEGGKRFKDRDADYNFNLKEKERQERIDKILDKIKKTGYEGLSEEEKKELFDNSRH